MEAKPKSKIIACVLAFFAGGLGVHWIYLNRPVRFLLYLLFAFTFIPTILSLVDIVIILCTPEDQWKEKYV